MDLGPGGRGGARRRTRRRHSRMNAASQAATPQPSAQPEPASMGNDTDSLLQMLTILHKEGILNDAEFQAKKQQLISRLA